LVKFGAGRRCCAFLALALASPAGAEVVSASANGFEVRETVSLDKPPAEAFAAFGGVGSWWSGEHSYSGNSANLSLALVPGGCFCERLPNGGVQHMHVTYVEPNKRVVLTGSLGPLLFLSTTGVMDVTFEPLGGGTRLVLDYRAAGFFNGGADKIAPAVDTVLREQVTHLKAYLATTR
jgi:uncharacterized protein YndB with AHSA1/START domain